MSEFKTDLGVKVTINPAPFKEALALKSAIAVEVSGANLDLNIDPNVPFTSQEFNTFDIVKIAMLIDSSTHVQNCVFDCLKHCTHDGSKITMDTFDDVDVRGDYYRIIFECVKENLLPFFEGLLSKYQPIIENLVKVALTPKEDQNSK